MTPAAIEHAIETEILPAAPDHQHVVLPEALVPLHEPTQAEAGGAFRPSFEPTRRDTSDQDFYSQAQAKPGEDADGEQHLYLNEPATHLLVSVMRAAFPGDKIPHFEGATLVPQQVNRLIGVLLENAHSGPEAALRPAFRTLADGLAEAAKADERGVVTAVNADPSRSKAAYALPRARRPFTVP